MEAIVLRVAEAVATAGGLALVVGGAVRDSLVGVDSKDLDIEVYGLAPVDLMALLTAFGKVDAVGASFGVLKVRTPEGDDLDVSLPRRESKAGTGHKGFLVQPDSAMTPRDAAARRDFTFNALALNPLTGEVLDFFGGADDLRAGLLRPTSEAFAEDALRVLRGMQFAARFGLRSTPEFVAAAAICKAEFHTLATERIWGEFQKLALRGCKPSLGLEVLREAGWLEFFPELAALIGCGQEAEWHPEGDVWTHTCHVTDAAAAIAERDGLTGEDRVVLVLAGLCHDLGKPATTAVRNGRITAHGHDVAGEQPTRSLLARMGVPQGLIERVVALVVRHMAHCNQQSLASVRRLAVALDKAGETVEMLLRVVESDMNGRPPLAGGLPHDALILRDLAAQAACSTGAVKPLLMGRHLIAAGWKSGPAMGAALKDAFQAQLDGLVSSPEEALAWIEAR